MRLFSFLVLNTFMITLFCQEIPFALAASTLTPSQSITDGQTLISQGGYFELGFFSPSAGSKNRYLGIWYKNIAVQTPVWVANRDSPLGDASGVLKIDSTGNIVVVNGTESVQWSSNSSNVVGSPIVELLDSGNLVLRDERNGDKESYLWQSFDYLGDTLLPGMKLGWDLKSGLNRYLTAWKSPDDPSPSGFTYGMEPNSYLESAIRNGSRKYYRGGPWNGVSHSGAPDLRNNPIFTYDVVHNAEEVYFMYELRNKSVILRYTLTQTGSVAHLERYTWAYTTNTWVLLVSIPRDRCDDYALCGVYSTCDVSNVAVCQCLKGFRPKSPEDWSATDWSQGCEREVPVNCSNGEGFRKYSGIKLPDTAVSWVNASMNLAECSVQCLRNCSCMAYAVSDVRKGGSGCLMWFTELLDIRQLTSDGEDLYLRMAASELDSKTNSKKKKLGILIASITCIVGLFILGLGGWCIWRKRSAKGASEKDNLELPLYDLATLKKATNNFSNENLLGEGGFGPVYKGQLQGGQEIAVKRLSKKSIQGGDEFKNEVILISKLQHRNLVKLIGCCIQGEEKLLIYEYLENKSLDSFIFDASYNRILDWPQRFDIIVGIARGLLYLHHDSRLRIIHRDLKASNILLDNEMVPKISDFGMARLCSGNETEAKTKRVVGTYGYMAPEYAMDGHFSVKSDVYSYGVLVLELISGKKNRSFCHPDHDLNLLGHAWNLWNEHKSMEMVDEFLKETCTVQDVIRCINVGLLCVQRRTEDRPTMSSVVLMLGSESLVLPKPQQPGFFMERSTSDDPSSTTEITMTLLDAR